MGCRSEEGIFLGIMEESQEVIVGTKEGVVKENSIRRNGSQEERWKAEMLDTFVGTLGIQPRTGRKINKVLRSMFPRNVIG